MTSSLLVAVYDSFEEKAAEMDSSNERLLMSSMAALVQQAAPLDAAAASNDSRAMLSEILQSVRDMKEDVRASQERMTRLTDIVSANTELLSKVRYHLCYFGTC